MGNNLFSHPGAEEWAYDDSSFLPSNAAWQQEEATCSWQIVPPIITGQLPVIARKITPSMNSLAPETPRSWQLVPPIITGQLPVVGKNAITTEPLREIAEQPQDAVARFSSPASWSQRSEKLPRVSNPPGQRYSEPLARRVEELTTPTPWQPEATALTREAQGPMPTERPGRRPFWMEDSLLPEPSRDSEAEPLAPVMSSPAPDEASGPNKRISGWQRGARPGLPPAGYVSRWDKWEKSPLLPPVGLLPLWRELLRLTLQRIVDGVSAQNALPQNTPPCFAWAVDGLAVTLAPLFVAALLTRRPFTAFLVGLASALGAGLTRMLFDLTLGARKRVMRLRSVALGFFTFLGGMVLTLPFLLPTLRLAFWTIAGVSAVMLVVLVITYALYMKRAA